MDAEEYRQRGESTDGQAGMKEYFMFYGSYTFWWYSKRRDPIGFLGA